MSMTVIGMAIAFALFVLTGCGAGVAQSDETAASKKALHHLADSVEIQGTVVHKDLEGGFFAIEGDDGRTYDPINLPGSYKREGLRVKATVRHRNDAVGIHMVGDIVEIIDIAAQ
jgi:hypothetical protein